MRATWPQVEKDIPRLARLNPLYQPRGLACLASFAGVMLLLVTVALISPHAPSKLDPTNAPKMDFRMQTKVPSTSEGFATPSIPPLAR